MKKLFLLQVLALPLLAKYEDIYGTNSIYAINSNYEFRKLFVLLQGDFWLSYTLVFGVLAIMIALCLHYGLVGPKKFSHSNFLQVYSSFDVILHWLTAIPFVILIITGFIITALKIFGYDVGGEALRLLRKIHMLSAIFVTPFILIMTIKWFKHALPRMYDIGWFLILGGYLSKNSKIIIKAGKFNAGQKMWFYIALFGGLALAFSGYNLYFLEGNIEFLRIMILAHLILGIIVTGFLLVHIYMSAFVVKGFGIMVDGKMPEEEVKYMHNEYYKELKGE